MATKKKLLQAAAGQAGGEALNVEDVFSTYLHTGTGAAKSIVNGVDLAGEGGLVWSKSRSNARVNRLIDTERGVTKTLRSDATLSEETYTDTLTSFNSDGFTLGADASSDSFNRSSDTYATWTFRKAPKFFDVVTYTGDGQSSKTISHSLGTTVGMMLVKQLNTSGDWHVFHRSGGSGNGGYLNATDAFSSTSVFPSAPTSTNFSVAVATNAGLNKNNNTYVAYLFAHNNADGEFGADGDADIIKCGSFNSGGSAADVDVNLGFEPQFVMFKLSSSAGAWHMYDTMRGIVTGGNDALLFANTTSAETVTGDYIDVTSTGFKFTTAGWNGVSGPNHDLIYIAIRRGTKVPEDADDVFAIDGENTSEPYHTSGFTVDMGLKKRQGSTGSWLVMDRLRQGKKLASDSTSAEVDETDAMFDYMDGMYAAAAYGEDASYGWMWKRAPGYFDALAFSGNDTNGRSLSHNLSAEPSMVWIKARNITKEWFVATDFTSSNYKQGYLHNTNALSTTSYSSGVEIASQPTNSAIVLNDLSTVNGTGNDYIAYLFASLPGISKVGSYTGNSTGNASGITQTIDCGFTSGARFVLIKKTNGTGSWAVFDTERGIVSGNDPYLKLNETTAESTVTDAIDPHSSGFTLTSSTLFNSNGDSYIFYAIA